MSEHPVARARAGFDAWRRGDFATIESMLDPGVQWNWFDPGEWDCHDRTDVMRVLRERYEQGFADGELEFLEGGSDSVILVAHPAAVRGPEWPEETATVLTFRDGKVIGMQDYRTKEDALSAIR